MHLKGEIKIKQMIMNSMILSYFKTNNFICIYYFKIFIIFMIIINKQIHLFEKICLQF